MKNLLKIMSLAEMSQMVLDELEQEELEQGKNLKEED